MMDNTIRELEAEEKDAACEIDAVQDELDALEEEAAMLDQCC